VPGSTIDGATYLVDTVLCGLQVEPAPGRESDSEDRLAGERDIEFRL